MKENKYDSVIVIDDHPTILLGLETILKDIFTFIFSSTDPGAGLKMIFEKKPNLVILDYHFPNAKGDVICKEIKYRLPKTKVLALSFDMEEEGVADFFSAGVNGFMLKSYHGNELLRCISYIMNGTDYFCKEAKSHLINRIGFNDHDEKIWVDGIDFTKNEVETIRLLSQQRSNKEIGEILFLSEKTIELYRSNIMKKTGAKNIVGVIKFALSRGIVKLNQM